MTKLFRRFLLSLLPATVGGAPQWQEDGLQPAVNGKLPSCFKTPEMPKYHPIDCQIDNPNSVRSRHLRRSRHALLLSDGVYYIPDEQTAVCPEVVENWEMGQLGHDTRFIFENVASTAVVLIFLQEGIEYSALDRRTTPPYNDKKAILQPGEWVAVNAFEGHVFYARELTEQGEMGRVLVQHQPGLVPIKNRFGHSLDCQEPSLPDDQYLAQLSVEEQEEAVKNAYREMDRKPSVDTRAGGARNRNLRVAMNHDSTSSSIVHEHCNSINKGFRNTLAGCPIDIFNSRNQQPVDGPMVCQEEFKLHLGVSPCPEDYMRSWESRMKFEPTYVGETWVARLKSNPDIVLDTYTVQPVYIRDCPSFVSDMGNNTLSLNGTSDKEQGLDLPLSVEMDRNMVSLNATNVMFTSFGTLINN